MSSPSSAPNNEKKDLLSSILGHIDERLNDKHVSLSHCIRKLFSTKQRPSRFVAALLPQGDLVTIQDTHKVILEHLSKVSDTLPCILSIKVVAAGVIFLQLILECSEKISSSDSQPMSVALIQSMEAAICKASKNNEVVDEIDFVPINEQHAPTLGGFFFGTVLRALNPYVPSFPMLLAPLWKSLCNVAAHIPQLPYDYMKASVVALLVYVKEGEQSCLRSAASFSESPQNHPSNLAQHHFHAKIQVFLVARLTSLLCVCCSYNFEDEEENQSLLQNVIEALVPMRGISTVLLATAATQLPTQILQSSKMIDKKIDQCLNKLFIVNSALNKAAISAVLAIQTSSKHCFESQCSRLGKVNVLQTAVRCISLNACNAEALLSVAEHLIFTAIPDCTCELVAWETFLIDSSVLHLAAQTAFVLDVTKGAHVRLMLLRWLSWAQHPLSRVAVVTIVHSYVVALGRVSRRIRSPKLPLVTALSPQEEPMLVMLSQLFFHFQTVTSHREVISSVLHRLLCSPDCQPLTSKALLDSLHDFLNKLQPISSRKCKHTGSGNSLNISDWNCILGIVICLNFASSEGLHRESQSMTDDLKSSHADTNSNIFFLKNRSPCVVAIYVAGAQYLPAIELLGWFLMQTHRRKKSSLLTRSGTVLTCAILRFLSRRLQQSAEAAIVSLVVKVLSWTLVQASQFISQQNEERGVCLALMMGEVLRRVGPSITPSTPPDALKEIASFFQSLFQFSIWSVSASIMTSLAEFASTIPKCHQIFLRTCLPDDMQGFFTSRLQGKVHRGKSAHDEGDFVLAQTACAQQVMKLVRPVPSNSTPFAMSKTSCIAPGSFVLSMPTVEGSGRCALVIFPPGEQSLRDIKQMLQKDNLDREGVLHLRRVRISNNGGGCRLFSEKYC